MPEGLSASRTMSLPIFGTKRAFVFFLQFELDVPIIALIIHGKRELRM